MKKSHCKDNWFYFFEQAFSTENMFYNTILALFIKIALFLMLF